MDKNLTTLLKVQIPDLNATEHDPEALNLKKIRDILLKPPYTGQQPDAASFFLNSEGKQELFLRVSSLVARALRKHDVL